MCIFDESYENNNTKHNEEQNFKHNEKPHMLALSNRALDNMIKTGKNQSKSICVRVFL
jgi:hypothetical protein